MFQTPSENLVNTGYVDKKWNGPDLDKSGDEASNLIELCRYVCIWARVLSRFCQIFCDRFGRASLKYPPEISISGAFRSAFWGIYIQIMSSDNWTAASFSNFFNP